MKYAALALAVALCGCGNREEKEFVEGCTQQVPSKDVCVCVYNHGSVSDELKTLEANQNDQLAVMRYMVALKEATQSCVKQLGLSPGSS